MPYQGHVENGTIVFDEPVRLAEGAKVQVELVKGTGAGALSLRGTSYAFDDPFSPAVVAEEWDATR